MSQNKRIARNTILLCIRMICSVCVSLYTSRLILKTLGVEDVGIYNIIGSVVALLGFLSSSMSGCTSRFFAYELGSSNEDKLKRIFNVACQVHIYIAIFILIIGETVGIWFVNSQLQIPENRIVTASVVYQISLLTTIITFLQIPYSSLTIAHERMDAYAYIELLNVSLRLCVVLLLTHLNFDKLIAYAFLLLVVTLIILLTYRFFCRRKFAVTQLNLSFRFDREVLFPLLKFTSWDIYGNSCVLIQQQGLNILINRFFGVILNAAIGVASQASAAVSIFVSSFTMALRPPIIKKYAVGDWSGLQNLLIISVVICAFLAEIVCLPLYLRINYIMELWLEDVPNYATNFCKWMLIANSVSVINNILVSVIHASGDIKRLSIMTGTIYLSTVIFSYISFRFSSEPETAYIILFIVSIVVVMTNIFIIRKQIPMLSLGKIFKNIILPILSLALSVFLTVLMNYFLPQNICGFMVLFLFNICIAFSFLYILWVGPRYGWNIIKLIRSNEI